MCFVTVPSFIALTKLADIVGIILYLLPYILTSLRAEAMSYKY